MSLHKVDSTTGDTSLIAGSMGYADNPIGTILAYGGTTAPAGWFLCQGQELTKTEYADLYAVIGDSFGTASANTKFKLPDLRGEFLRGAGTNNHSGQGNGGSVGRHQDSTKILSDTIDTGKELCTAYINNNNCNSIKNADTSTKDTTSVDGSTYMSISHSTTEKYIGYVAIRPTNTSVNYIIKAKHIDAPADFVQSMGEFEKYSTNEVLTNKTWIDGKPIYRLVVTGLSFGAVTKSWTTTGYTLNDCDSLISGCAMRTSQRTVINEMVLRVNNNVLQYYTDSGWSDCDQVIIEYTKTTD